MSLYDKAKVFFSAAAGAGGKDVAYNIKPVEKLKVDELITNNKLLTSDGWSFSDSNITVASGKIVFNNAAQYATARWDTDVFEEGKTYKVSFKVEDFKGGASNSKLLAQQANNTQIDTEIDRDGNYSFYYTPGAPDGTTHQNKFQLKTVTTSVEAKVSGFSIKEVEQKANDFSFVRASDLTATYEGADGLIKKTRENLVEYSNDFIKWDDDIVDGVADSFNGYTITSGKSGYDGSNNATLVEKTGSQNSYIFNDINTVSHNGVFTYSIYARDGGDANSSIHLYIGDSSNKGNLRVNLNTGAVLGGANVLNTVEAITGDPGDTDRWYRVSFTNDANVSDKPRIQVRDNTGGQNTNGKAFIQNAQFEQGLVATPYIDRTGAAYSTSGIREDEPRYDYSLDNALPPVLMMEPKRTNELPHSEYLDSFVKNTGITLTPNTTDTKSPEGLYNATKVVSTNSSGGFYKSGLNITEDTVNSIYLKGAVGGETCKLKDPGGYGGITNITLTTSWVRYELKSTYSGLAGQQHQGLYVDDIASGSTIYAWGAQKEKGSYATSYIPTYGSVATREPETASIKNINAGTSYTVLFDFDGTSNELVNTILYFFFDDNDKVNQADAIFTPRWHKTDANENDSFRIYDQRGLAYPITSAYTSTTKKWVMRVDGTSFDLFRNNAGTPQQITGAALSGTRFLQKIVIRPNRQLIKQLIVFDSALTNEECLSLTT